MREGDRTRLEAKEIVVLLARRVGAALLVFAAIAVWFLLAPDERASESADFSSEIAAALAAYDENNSSADSAPQQEVVNGWAAKDLLTVIARAENAALSPQSAPMDERIPAELLLLVLGLALLALTSPMPQTQGVSRPPTHKPFPETQGPQSAPSTAYAAAPALVTAETRTPGTTTTTAAPVPANGSEARRLGRKHLALFIAAGVALLAVAGIIVWTSIASSADTTCSQLASNHVLAADKAHEDMPEGDLRDELDGVSQLRVDAERMTSDLKMLFPPTVSSKQEFVESRTEILDKTWAVCEEETHGFPSTDSGGYYDNVRKSVVEAAEYRWNQDGNG